MPCQLTSQVKTWNYAIFNLLVLKLQSGGKMDASVFVFCKQESSQLMLVMSDVYLSAPNSKLYSFYYKFHKLICLYMD